MPAGNMILKSLKRCARHVRLLALLEGALLLAVSAGWALFLAVVLDHAFSLTSPPRVALLAAILAITIYVLFSALLLPMVYSVSRLYVARRLERAFPHFKDSLTTFVEMKDAERSHGAGPLVAHHAAQAFSGVDIDAGLDARRFVKMGYAFVVLVLVVFGYSIFSAKSMWTSFVRLSNPWSMVPPPTRTHISSVQPGDTKAVQGSDVEISAEISGIMPESVLVRWSRDGELWNSLPMRPGEDVWIGSIDHIETDISYFLSAGDAASRVYTVETLVPPVAQSVTARLDFPDYTQLETRTVTEGNIEAPVGTLVSLTVESNKILSEARLSLLPDTNIKLAIHGSRAEGGFTVTRSGRYAVHLVDSEGLEAQAPVKYDIIAIPDNPPQVALKGPPDGASVGLAEGLDFELKADDDYGVSRLVFHFQTVEGNPDAKEFTLPANRREVARSPVLVPELLGARPGDTVSYYLEALDNRSGLPASARTAAYSFTVAPSAQTPIGTGTATIDETMQEGEDRPGRPQRAEGDPESEIAAPSTSFEPSADAGSTEDAETYSRLIEMLERDSKTWQVIAQHMEESGAGAQSVPQAAQEPPERVGNNESGEREQSAAPESTTQPRPRSPQGDTSETRRDDTKGIPGASGASGAPTGPSQEGSLPGGEQPGGQDAPSRPPGDADDSAEPGVESGAIPGQSAGEGGPEESLSADGEEGSSPSAGAPEDGQEAPGEAEAGNQSQSGAPQQGGQSPSAPSGGESAASQAPGESAPSDGQPSEGSSPAGSPSSGQSPSSSGEGEGQSAEDGAGQGDSDAAGSGREGSGLPANDAQQGASPEASADLSGQESEAPDQASSAQADDSTGSAGSGGATDRPGEVGPFDTRRDVELPDAEAAPDATNTGERVEAIRRMTDALVRDLEKPRVNMDMLRDLGWNPATLRTFVRAYEEALSEVDKRDFEEWLELDGSFPPGELVTGTRDASAVGGADTAADEASPGGEDPSKAFVSEDVSPEYRRLVEEYYKALANQSERE